MQQQAHILIVDDDDNNRAVLSDALSSEPYVISEAGNGMDALEMAKKDPPDLILLDVVMAPMDGITVLRKLKAESRTRNIPVIMVTVLNMETQVSACLDEGAIDHIPKPFSNLVVRSRIRAVLRHNTPASPEVASHKRGRIIGFLGAKGGMGTTTIVANVAMALAQEGKNVVAAELRPYLGTLALQLGLKPVRNLAPLLEDSQDGGTYSKPVVECLTKSAHGLQVLLAPSELNPAEKLGATQTKKIVEGLSNMFDYTLLDLPGPSSESIWATLPYCNFVLLVVELETSSAAAAFVVLKALERCGIGSQSIGAAITNRQETLTGLTMNQIRSVLTCPIIGVIPKDANLCISSIKSGMPIVLAQPESTCAVAFTKLANSLTEEPVPALVF